MPDRPADDSASVQAVPVTPETEGDPVSAAVAALHDHKASCWEPGCDACVLLTAAWRRALRQAGGQTREVSVER